MSVDRFVEPWEEMQRQGQDLADRLAQGFTGLLHSHISPPAFAWPSHSKKPFDADLPAAAAEGVSAILDIGNRLGQAGAEFGSCLNGVVHQFFRQLPVPFRHDVGGDSMSLLREELEIRNQGLAVERSSRDLGLVVKQFGESGFPELSEGRGSDDSVDEDWFDSSIHSSRSQGSISYSAKYDSRTSGTESSLVARGGLWRAEASHGGSTSGNANLPLFLVQLGPVLFVRDTTLLLPVHLSKQHLLWYGYDRKNGIHSLCPAIWSKHRRWLLMSMICLNPFACSFLDLQFPNGQLTYVAGEGLTTSAFLPIFGGLLQAQGQYPGETRISFSCKNKRGTRVTPMMQFPDKSFSLGLVQALAWRKSGLMVRPTVQFSVCPTLGGSDPGLRAELIHSLRDGISLIYGGSCAARPSAFASASLGRSKWNTNVGKIGVVVGVETPLGNIGRPSFSIQLNGGAEF